jgi:hypothetical protein
MNDYLLQQPGPQIFVGVYIIFKTVYPQYASKVNPLTVQDIMPGA